jgi:alanine-synthesizing transaminase
MERAKQMEAAGESIIKLNIGNVPAFGLNPPPELVEDMIRHLPETAGYTDSKGLLVAREAIQKYTVEKGIAGVTVEDIWLGNGASELIVMSMNALLDPGDEVLIPSPDYPLYTGAVALSGGTPVHYRCDEASGWQPDLADMQRKVTPRTKGIVIINPNNPTGAVYPREVLLEVVRLARHHQLVIFADEVYDQILYDGETHTSIASLAEDVLFLTFNSLSKNYRACGYRAGWMVLSGPKASVLGYVDGLNVLASMRLCANSPGQLSIRSALADRTSMAELVAPGGRLRSQRDLAYEMLTAIPGVTAAKPKGALYIFPRLDPKRYPITDDQRFILQLLEKERVLLVQGSGFNWPAPDHFRMVFLPDEHELREAITRIARFLDGYGR